MKMNKSLKTFLLSGMATAFSLFHANGQDVEKKTATHPDHKQKVALTLRANLLSGDAVRYQQGWEQEASAIEQRFVNEGFALTTLGTGYDFLELAPEKHRIDQALATMRQNKQDDVVFISAHGERLYGENVKGEHHIFAIEDASARGERNHKGVTKTIGLIKKMAERGYEKKHENIFIALTCRGDQIILDAGEAKLPPGTNIVTFAQSSDVTLSGDLEQSAIYSNDSLLMNDPVKLFHRANLNLPTHKDDPKAPLAVNGVTVYRVKENGEAVVLSARQMIHDRLGEGKGLSPEDRDAIRQNFGRYESERGTYYKTFQKASQIQKKPTMDEVLDDADQILKSTAMYETLDQHIQSRLFYWVSLIGKESPYQDYVQFARTEASQRQELSRTLVNAADKIQTMPVQP